jgi:hypothetical protein
VLPEWEKHQSDILHGAPKARDRFEEYIAERKEYVREVLEVSSRCPDPKEALNIDIQYSMSKG